MQLDDALDVLAAINDPDRLPMLQLRKLYTFWRSATYQRIETTVCEPQAIHGFDNVDRLTTVQTYEEVQVTFTVQRPVGIETARSALQPEYLARALAELIARRHSELGQ